EYDDNGNLRHQYDPRDLHTEFVYDELNRKKEHIQPDGLATTYKYDEEGNIKSTTDPNNNLITYDYDELNRETDVYYPEDPDSPFISTVSIHTDYDGNNNVIMITEIKKGQDGSDITDVTDNNYDEFDRLDNSTQRGVMTAYKYDENGNRTEVSTLAGTTTYTYDRRNRLKTAVIGDKTTIYTYTQDGKTDTVTYSNDAGIKYNYHDSNRISDIIHRSGTGEIISRYEYTHDKNGNRKTLTELQNGKTEKTEYNYDTADRLEDYTTDISGNKIITKYTYENYNRKSENVGIIFFRPTEDNIEGLKDEGLPEEITGKLLYLADIEYATEDQFAEALKLAIGEVHTAQYRGMIVGAMQSEKPLKARDYEYDDLTDRLMTVAHTDWVEIIDNTDPDNPKTLRVPVPKTLSYTYDDNGSMLTKSDSLHPSDDLTFDYNARNQMVRAMRNGTAAGLYDYNADGMRVRHYSSERGDVDYYYDGRSVIEERRA
ncbi:MAG: RHS repeat protein, partial [FCB group bacterium]|nr:RHS repeat protein [FCB group bacterium]